jgi:hypothetical protein
MLPTTPMADKVKLWKHTIEVPINALEISTSGIMLAEFLLRRLQPIFKRQMRLGPRDRNSMNGATMLAPAQLYRGIRIKFNTAFDAKLASSCCKLTLPTLL